MTTATSVTESFLFDEAMTAIIFQIARDAPQMYPLLFDVRPSMKGNEKIGTYAGLGLFTTVTEEQLSPEDKLEQQHTKTFVHDEYKKKVPVSRRVFDDEDWGYIAQIAPALGRAMAQTFDSNSADLWNGAFTTTTVPDAGSSTTTLIADTHNNADSSYSYDNKLTAVFGVEGVRQARQLLRDLTDAKGQPADANLDTVIVPTDLEEAALEVARSTDRPDTASRATNIYFGNLEVIVWNRLTSATAWFGLDTIMAMMNSILFVRKPPEMWGSGNVDSGVRYYGGYFRKSQGFVDGRGIVGSTGAG